MHRIAKRNREKQRREFLRFVAYLTVDASVCAVCFSVASLTSNTNAVRREITRMCQNVLL